MTRRKWIHVKCSFTIGLAGQNGLNINHLIMYGNISEKRLLSILLGWDSTRDGLSLPQLLECWFLSTVCWLWIQIPFLVKCAAVDIECVPSVKRIWDATLGSSVMSAHIRGYRIYSIMVEQLPFLYSFHSGVTIHRYTVYCQGIKRQTCDWLFEFLALARFPQSAAVTFLEYWKRHSVQLVKILINFFSF